MLTFSDADILNFLDILSQRSEIPKNTANAQKAAVIKVLDVLNAEEKTQLSEKTDLDALARRFQNKSKHELNSVSLRTYIGRFKTAFKGYIQWTENPTSFKPKTKRGRPFDVNSNKPKKNNLGSKNSSAIQATEISSPSKMYNYPIRTEKGDGYLEMPGNLSVSDINKIIPLVTTIIKSLCNESSS